MELHFKKSKGFDIKNDCSKEIKITRWRCVKTSLVLKYGKLKLHSLNWSPLIEWLCKFKLAQKSGH